MYKQIQSVVAADFEAVNTFIIEQLHSDVPLVENIGHYIIGAGGKRMRPVLVLLSARSCGFTGKEAVQLAAVIEFIHTATLLHDDVVDMSTLRRGRPTANQQWNAPSSVLVGDFIYSRAFQILVALGSSEIMGIIADTTNKIAEGEVQQLLNKHNVAVSQQSYMNVIRDKTAILFQAAAQCGAIVGGASAESQTAFKQIGMHIGMAFQLVDDVLDYAGDRDSLGKNVGDDLAEGKPTLPLIIAMERGTRAEAALIRKALEPGACDHLEDIIGIVRESGGLDHCRALAHAEIEQARTCLQAIPASKYRDALEQMAELAISRSK